MVRKTGILTQEQVDELIGKTPGCGRCKLLEAENKAVNKTLNKMIDQYSGEIETLKAEKEELLKALQQAFKD
jgi:hypothetical protein